MDQKWKGYSPREVVDALIKEEEWRQVLSSLVVCFFARGLYTPEIVIKAFQPLGVETTEEELRKLGERIYNEKLRLKRRLGFTPESLDVPKRVYELPTPLGELDEKYIREALNYYSEIFQRITG
jgi:aldehyde:ferredoxin oxidoreductase